MGLPVFRITRADWQRKRCYEEIVRLADRAEFQELLRLNQSKGRKKSGGKADPGTPVVPSVPSDVPGALWQTTETKEEE